MSIQTINIGAVADDGTGDPLRIAFGKTNDNFLELESNVSSLTASINLVNSNAVVLASNVSSLTASVSNILTGTTSFSGNKTFTGNVGIGIAPTAKLHIAETWNNVSTTFTAIRSNVTDTASAAGSLLLDLQVAGASKFRVGKDGQVSAGSFMMGSSPESTTSMSGLSRNGNNLLVNTVGTQAFNFSTASFISTRPIAFGASAYTADVVLNRDAANILAQRNGTSAQTQRIYNTYTDASNYERGVIGWTANALQIGTEAAGTGTLRNINLIGGNVLIGTAVDNGYKVNITGNVYANSNVVISGTTTLLGNLKVNAGINANNSLGTAGQVLTSNGTIAYWSSPAYGAFQSVSNQFCAANTATAMLFEITDFAGGVSMTANSYIGLPNPGTYNLQFSVQTKNTGNAEDTLYIWLRQNNVDIVGSTGKVIVRGTQSGGSGESITGWNFFVRSTAPNENIRIMWFAADETHTHFAAFPAQSATGSTPAIPSTASTVLTVNQIG
jgi:hypothetical protein